MDFPSSGNTAPFPAIPYDVLVEQKEGQAISTWLIGAFCVLCWELIICAPKEYRLVWKKPMNASSLLYLSNRYFGLIEFCFIVSMTTDAWSPTGCKRVYLIEPIGGLISTILSQAILGRRVFAIYSRNKAFGYILGGILLAEAIVGGVSAISSSPPSPIPSVPSGSQPPCGTLKGRLRWSITYWTMPLLYDSLTFALTAWKAYYLWKLEAKTRLVDIILYDGLLYFFANLAMNIVNVMIFFFAPAALRDFNMAPTVTFQIILSCRMFLHLKGSNDQIDLERNTLSNNDNQIRFRSYISNGTSPNNSNRSKSTADSNAIPIDTKRATVVGAEEVEFDARVTGKASEVKWDMA